MIITYPTTDVMFNDSENITLQKILFRLAGNPAPPPGPKAILDDANKAILDDQGKAILE